jgi:hypothetical protein
MITHSEATGTDACDGELVFENRIVKGGTSWNVFRCLKCRKRILAEPYLTAESPFGIRYTEED